MQRRLGSEFGPIVMKPRSASYLTLLLLVCGFASAQDVEPRRWSQIPTGTNFIGIGLGYSSGDIYLDPVLQIENAEYDMVSAGLVYMRTFGLFGKSARFDVRLPYASGNWQGDVAGEFTEVDRQGFGDPRVRLSMLLYGGPAETPQEFASNPKSNTVVGAAIAVTAPYGEYFADKLINLGANRWTVHPQLGITHTRGKWTYELTGSAFFYSDNDEFFNGTELENDPLYAVQAHFIYTLRPGLWMSFSSAYGSGAKAAINGIKKDSKAANWLNALSISLPINRFHGLKFTYLNLRTQNDTGADSDGILAAYSYMF